MTEAGERCAVRGQLDSVLSNLYDFGDDFVTHEENAPELGERTGLSDENESEKVNDSVEDQRPVVSSKRGRKNVSMFFDSIKDELCSQARNPTVPSGSASKPSAVEVVTFVSRKDKKESKDQDMQAMDPEKTMGKTEEGSGLELNFEKARLEVHRFGISGYKKEKQRKFEQERAIMLGAKPPKREYVNYKLYQEKLKEKSQERKVKNFMGNGLEPVSKKQGKSDRRSRKTKGSGMAPSGQVGRFRNGALFLSGKDIEKIKKSRVIK